MNYSWEFTTQAEKDLRKLSKDVARRLVRKLDYFVDSGKPLDFADKLINYELGQYRFRMGDYRIVFDIRDGKIIVLTLGHRKDIYR